MAISSYVSNWSSAATMQTWIGRKNKSPFSVRLANHIKACHGETVDEKCNACKELSEKSKIA